MLRLWVLVCLGIVCGCSQPRSASRVQERHLTAEERVEMRSLVESLRRTDYQRDFVGKTTGDAPRLFALAEEVHAFKDGRRVYSYRMHEPNESYEGMTDFWIITDGGGPAPASPETAKRCETILEVNMSVACN